ncbi:MAG: segregation and condensation protein A [Bianqueaceae bacterium]
MALEVRLPVFEGPLDLLLHLIEKNQLNIYDIPIFEVTKQYLEYLRQMNEMNMEIASEFVVMAATLINIKARMLLPAAQKNEEEEEDPREALIARLLEYKKYKQAAAFLRENQTGDSELILYRKPEDIQGERPMPTLEELLEGVTLQELYSVYTKLMRGKRDSVDMVRSQFNSVEKTNHRGENRVSHEDHGIAGGSQLLQLAGKEPVENRDDYILYGNVGTQPDEPGRIEAGRYFF